MAGSSSLLWRAQALPLVVASAYLVFLIAMLSPWLQSHFLFLHKIQFPFNPDFDNPTRYGIAPFKARNLRLTSSDGIEIGAWHVLPDGLVRSLGTGPYEPSVYDQAFKDYPTVVYLHGNAANRAAPFRTATYALLTGRLNVNVVAIDYRGFGDSQGSPTEAGLVRDAKAAWDFVLSKRGSQGYKDSSETGAGLVVMGQSLGTGVAAQLTLELTQTGTPPQGLVLIAPYSSLRGLITGYRIGGVVPVFAPLASIPGSNRFLDSVLYTHFNTSAVLPNLFTAARSLPPTSFPHVIIDHATDDEVIPFGHSEQLFDGLLRHEYGRQLSEEELRKAREANVDKKTIDKFGTIETMRIPHNAAPAGSGQDGPTVTLIRTHHGGHNRVGEGVIDIAGDKIGLERT